MTPLLQEWLALFENVRRSGERFYNFTCPLPGHKSGDARPSGYISTATNGKIVLGCWLGHDGKDIAAAVGKSLEDMYPDRRVGDEAPPTLADLCWLKRLPKGYLRDEWGLEDNDSEKYGHSVHIPVYDEGTKKLYVRFRVRLFAEGDKPHTKHPKNTPSAAYGLWRLDEARAAGRSLVLVEGESDTWTLWYHKIPALGIPGARNTDVLDASMLEGFDTVYVWDERDGGAPAFLRGCAARFAAVGWSGRALAIHGGGVKDPSSLHMRDPDGFEAAFAEILKNAEPIADAVGRLAAAAPEADGGRDGGGKRGRAARTVRVPGAVTAGPTDSRPLAAPGHYGLTDVGNTQRLVFRHGEDVRWCRGWKQWLVWDNGRWAADAEDQVAERARDTVAAIYAEASQAEDRDLRRDIARHAVASESARSVYDMVRLLRSERRVWINVRDLDNHPWLLNCPNGTLDLHTGDLMGHRKGNYLTKMCPTAYDADAPCPQWLKVLDDVFLGDRDLIAYVQRLLGYCLTGDTRRHLFVVFWGHGSNGKGTLLNTIYDVLGDDYASASMSDMLMERRGERHPTEIADLFGKRFVTVQETADNQSLNEPLVKWLSGGDVLSARRMHENLWRFKPTHKIILATNYRPKIQGTDKGIWRRVRLVPFTAVFEGAREDTGLRAALLGEASGILAWCVRGCLEWQRLGECPPQVVLAATEDYRNQEDIVRRFIEECVRPGGGRVKASNLYAVFKEWAEKCGERRVPSQKKFGTRMTDLGYERVLNNGVWYLGVELVDQRPKTDAGGHPSGSAANGCHGKNDAREATAILSGFDE